MRKILSILLILCLLLPCTLLAQAAIAFPCDCGGILDNICSNCGATNACTDCGWCSACGSINHDQGTTIEVVGQYASAEYTVTVPAKLEPGETAQVVVKGAWMPSQTLKVSCPNTVTLSYEGQTMDIGISFAGIEQVGSYTEAFNISKDISVEDKTVLFGTWTGHLDYTVEFIDNTVTNNPPKKLMMSIKKETQTTEFQYEEGMTWGEWVESEYNTENYTLGVYPYGEQKCEYIVSQDGYFVMMEIDGVYHPAHISTVIDTDLWFTSKFSGGADN